MNVFREKLPFRDIPLKLYLRARTQTDPSHRRAARRDLQHLGFDEPAAGLPKAHAGPADSGFGLASEVNDLLADLDD